jgi:hypothetical protein
MKRLIALYRTAARYELDESVATAATSANAVVLAAVVSGDICS